MRALPWQRRQAWHAGQDLPDLWRQRGRAHVAGLLLDPASLPDLPRLREGDPGTVRDLPWRRPRQEAQDAFGEDPRRSRRRRPHPPRRRGRGRRERRPVGRPVCRDPPEGTRGVPARRRQPALRDADQLHPRGPRRRSGDPDAGGAGQGQGARGDPVRAGAAPARQGHQGRALQLSRRPAVRGRGRDPGAAYRRQKDLLRELDEINRKDGDRHNPRAKSFMDKVRDFFTP